MTEKTTKTTELIQLQLWADEEIPELQSFSQNQEHDAQEAMRREAPAPVTQLYLPGMEPK